MLYCLLGVQHTMDFTSDSEGPARNQVLMLWAAGAVTQATLPVIDQELL